MGWKLGSGEKWKLHTVSSIPFPDQHNHARLPHPHVQIRPGCCPTTTHMSGLGELYPLPPLPSHAHTSRSGLLHHPPAYPDQDCPAPPLPHASGPGPILGCFTPSYSLHIQTVVTPFPPPPSEADRSIFDCTTPCSQIGPIIPMEVVPGSYLAHGVKSLATTDLIQID